MTAIELDVELQRSTPAEALMSFLCPVCEQRLNVPACLAGVAGPCPSCQRVIRAPQFPKLALTDDLGNWMPNAGENGSTDLNEVADVPREQSSPVLGSAPSFCATKRIAPPPPDGMDDSWRKKVERNRKQSRKRRRRNRWLRNFIGGKTFQKVGTLLILGILAVTVGILYMNHRSGGQLFSGRVGG
jgi:hypothetical protein